MVETLKPTQADREAAADLMVEQFTGVAGLEGDVTWAVVVRCGEADCHPIVQAFARHRVAAASEAEREEMVEIEAPMRTVIHNAITRSFEHVEWIEPTTDTPPVAESTGGEREFDDTDSTPPVREDDTATPPRGDIKAQAMAIYADEIRRTAPKGEHVARDMLDNPTPSDERTIRAISAALQPLSEVREVLEPFAVAADDLDERHGDHSSIWEASAAMSIDAGHLRRAAALLATLPPATSQEIEE